MILIARPSPNWDERPVPVDLVVLHYTGMATTEDALARLTDAAPVAGRYPGPWQDPATPPDTPLGRVSAHYVVGEDGSVFALVDEDKRAWHAGVSHWEGRSDTNARSIGIEIANGGHDFDLPAFPDAQIAAVEALVEDILTRRRLGPHQVVGHSDIAPGRKLDPGERFPWARLAARGLALWPSVESDDRRIVAQLGDEGMAVLAAQETLAAIGYGVVQTGVFDEATRLVVEAFQRRFRPAVIDGLVDQACAAMMADLSAQLARSRLSKLQS